MKVVCCLVPLLTLVPQSTRSPPYSTFAQIHVHTGASQPLCLGTVLGQQVWTLPYTIFWRIDLHFSVPFFNCKKITEELNSVLDSTCRQSQKTKWVQLNSLILTLICILVHSCTLNAICCTLLHVVLIQLGLNKPVLFVGLNLAAHAKTLIIVLTDKWLINCSVWMNNFSQAQ